MYDEIKEEHCTADADRNREFDRAPDSGEDLRLRERENDHTRRNSGRDLQECQVIDGQGLGRPRSP